jgi:hypothetical protein
MLLWITFCSKAHDLLTIKQKNMYPRFKEINRAGEKFTPSMMRKTQAAAVWCQKQE